jgi:hypothetical protein
MAMPIPPCGRNDNVVHCVQKNFLDTVIIAVSRKIFGVVIVALNPPTPVQRGLWGFSRCHTAKKTLFMEQ